MVVAEQEASSSSSSRVDEAGVLWRKSSVSTIAGGGGKPAILMICGGLVYYHCAFRHSSFVTLVSDGFIVLLCSLAILGLLFRQMNVEVPVDPLDWQISQDIANSIFACLANTIGAAESVLRVAATGHDKRLFFKVVTSLYVLSALGRMFSGATVAFTGLCLLCLYMLTENSQLISSCFSRFSRRRDAIGTTKTWLRTSQRGNTRISSAI